MSASTRKVIHVDMDAFYASVEQRDHPHLKHQPLAVAWGGKRSVVLTASYEARPYGIRSAMPLYKALERCPHLLVVPPRFDAYREVSTQIRAVFHQFTPLVEPLSLDEAYLDVTNPLQGGPSATHIAQHIKREILARTNLTATAGISVNKFLAKLASGMNKPNGLTVILPAQVQELLAPLPVTNFHGIGPATARKLQAHGIHTGTDLARTGPQQLMEWFGKVGEHYWRIAHGLDDRPVDPHRPHKSIGAEETYGDDLHGVNAVRQALPPIARNVERRLSRAGLAGKTVVLKIKFDDWSVITRRTTLTHTIWHAEELLQVAAGLVTPELVNGRPVRLLGITCAGLRPPSEPPPRLL